MSLFHMWCIKPKSGRVGGLCNIAAMMRAGLLNGGYGCSCRPSRCIFPESSFVSSVRSSSSPFRSPLSLMSGFDYGGARERCARQRMLRPCANASASALRCVKAMLNQGGTSDLFGHRMCRAREGIFAGHACRWSRRRSDRRDACPQGERMRLGRRN